MRIPSLFLVVLAFLGGLKAACADVVQVIYPVPFMTIYTGDAIAPDMLIEKRFRLSNRAVGSYIRDLDQIVGKVARRTLVAGRPIPSNALQTSEAVTEGSSVTLVFDASGFTIKGLGKAIQAGSVGDTISVQNIDSGRLVRGVIQHDGTVNVGGL
ncbi:MAG: flagellar basal body P-ring formation chaperone FlgA [Alphaproteobacteria bacterium]|nr:flagellar basal body P-ring formation chaperone FlgA [Alphaproteobacteria bacterium]